MLLFTYSITAAHKRAWIVVHGVSADSAEKSGMRVKVSAAFPRCWKVWSTASTASSNSASPSTTPTLHLTKPIASLPAASSCKMQSMSGKAAATAAIVSCVFSCTKLCSSILVKHVYRLRLSTSTGVFHGRIQLVHQRLCAKRSKCDTDSEILGNPRSIRLRHDVYTNLQKAEQLYVHVCLYASVFVCAEVGDVLTRDPGAHHRKKCSQSTFANLIRSVY